MTVYCLIQLCSALQYCIKLTYQLLLHVNTDPLTSDKLINSGIIPSMKHPTNIARDMRITAQAPSMTACALQLLRSKLLTHSQAASHVTNTLKHKRKTQYPLSALTGRHSGVLHVSTPSTTLNYTPRVRRPALHDTNAQGTVRFILENRFLLFNSSTNRVSVLIKTLWILRFIFVVKLLFISMSPPVGLLCYMTI